MRTIITIAITVAFLFIAGCGDAFTSGVITGATTVTAVLADKTDEVNTHLDKLNAAYDKADDTADTVNALSNNPIGLISYINPELGNNVAKLMANLEMMGEKADEFKDEEGKVDWERLIMYGMLGVFGGGTATNVVKNRNGKKNE